MKNYLFPFICLTGIAVVSAQVSQFNSTSVKTDAELEPHFQAPPASARPWLYWMRLPVNTTPEAITKNLDKHR